MRVQIMAHQIVACLCCACLVSHLNVFANDPLTSVEIIAHRGASFDAPENTLESFRLGWDQQADAVELDVMISSDGHIVVIHDTNTKRLSGVDRPVVSQSLNELQTLDVGKWKDPRWTGIRIPLLSEVLPTIPENKRLFIEVKCGPEIIPELKRELAAAGKRPEQTVVIGFSRKTMEAVKLHLPNLEVYWIVDIKPNLKASGSSAFVDELIRQAKESHLDGLDLSADESIDRRFATAIRDAGLTLAVWTINDASLARRMVEAGVQGITTDRPGWMREQLCNPK